MTIFRTWLCLPAGQERFGNMTRVYYRDALGALVVYDMTRSCTFEAVRKWKEDLDDKVSVSGGKQIAAVLLANKCDQDRDDAFAKTYAGMEQFCREHGFISWFETSAKVLKCLFRVVTWVRRCISGAGCCHGNDLQLVPLQQWNALDFKSLPLFWARQCSSVCTATNGVFLNLNFDWLFPFFF